MHRSPRTAIRPREVFPRCPFHPRSFGDRFPSIESLQDVDERFGGIQEGTRGGEEGPRCISSCCCGGQEKGSGGEEPIHSWIRSAGQGSHSPPIPDEAPGQV